MHLRPLLVAAVLSVSPTFAAESVSKAAPTPAAAPAAPVNPADAANIVWHDVTQWGLEGRAWPEMERTRWFDRLPSVAEKTVTTNVWNLSRDSAGMMVRFKTDASAISVHYRLRKPEIGLPHMPATGVSGVDLYARNADGQWRWVMVAVPKAKEVRTQIIKDLAPGVREYAAYLPLYNGVDSLEIGVPPGAKF